MSHPYHHYNANSGAHGLAFLVPPKGAAQVSSEMDLSGSWSWLSVPPSAIRVVTRTDADLAARKHRRCPSPGQWLLLYWAGPPSLIDKAALSCLGAQRAWASQQGRWRGYDAVNPQASDMWEVQPGEATFLYREVLGGPGQPTINFVQP